MPGICCSVSSQAPLRTELFVYHRLVVCSTAKCPKINSCAPCSFSPTPQTQACFFQISLCLPMASRMNLFYHRAMLLILDPSCAVSLALVIHQQILLVYFWNKSRTLCGSQCKCYLHCWCFIWNGPCSSWPDPSAALFSRAGHPVHFSKFYFLIYSYIYFV